MRIKTLPKQMFGQRVLVLLDPIASTLELPDQRQYEHQTGTVIMVGDGKSAMAMRERDIPVKHGDRILMPDTGFESVELLTDKGLAYYRICHVDDILGLLPDLARTAAELVNAGATEITVHADGSATEGL